MSRLFRRTLTSLSATAAATPTPGPSTASTLPIAVRRRRLEHPATHRPSPLTESDQFVSQGGGPRSGGPGPARRLPAALEDQFNKLRANGQFKGDEASARKAFLATQQAWRSRVRGRGQRSGEDGVSRAEPKPAFFARADPAQQSEQDSAAAPAEDDDEAGVWHESIVGERIYLPNVQIRLMRNHTAPGEAYDPWVATFRIPPSMTKNDLRSYLSAVYGLDVTFIRTDNYIAPVQRYAGGEIRHQAGSRKNYKRAVVGLKEAFHYPDDIDEMRAGTFGGVDAGQRMADEREATIEKEFALEQSKSVRKRYQMKMHKGWRWRSATHDNAGNTVREIMRRRAEREQKIADEVARMVELASKVEAELPAAQA